MSSSKSTLHRTFGIDVSSHGDLTGTSLDPTVNLEVIGVGLSRTGTTSVQAALTKLGFAPSHQVRRLLLTFPHQPGLTTFARVWTFSAPSSVPKTSSICTRKYSLASGTQAIPSLPTAYASSCADTDLRPTSPPISSYKRYIQRIRMPNTY